MNNTNYQLQKNGQPATGNRQLISLILSLFIATAAGAQVSLKEAFSNAVQSYKAKDYMASAQGFTYVLTLADNMELKKFCHIYRAFAYRDMKLYKNAVADMDTAIALDPTDAASYTDRGKMKMYMGDDVGAISDFKAVLRTDSVADQAQAAYFFLGKIAYAQTRFEDVVFYYDKLLTLVPTDAEAYFDRGAAKSMLGNHAGAIADYTKAINLNPNYREAYANRGVAKINQFTTGGTLKPTKSQTSSACDDFTKAKSLGDTTVDDMLFLYCK